MNNERRKNIRALFADLGKLDAELDALQGEIEAAVNAYNEKLAEAREGDLLGSIIALRDEEQEHFDNMPESLQGSEKGQAAEASVQQLEEAIGLLENLEDFEPDLHPLGIIADLQDYLEEAAN